MSAADVVEHVTHAITQSAISAKVTAHPARIVVEVADPVRRYALTGMVCTGPITRAVYEEPDGPTRRTSPDSPASITASRSS